jgi:hypothetical protein
MSLRLLCTFFNFPFVSPVAQGFAVVCPDMDSAIEVTDRLAPEHLEVQVRVFLRVYTSWEPEGCMFTLRKPVVCLFCQWRRLNVVSFPLLLLATADLSLDSSIRQVIDADSVWKRISNYGAMFIGQGSAEVFGDYGAGPNHVLPTSGTARYTGGLSVFTFLVSWSWTDDSELCSPDHYS